MLYIPYKVGEIIGVCTKTASTSISNEFLHPRLFGLTSAGVVELKKSRWKVTGIVRDPLERLESAYNFFQYAQQGSFPNKKTYKTINHFIDSVLAGDSDAHWLPQAEQLLLCDSFVDLETVGIERRENSNRHIEKIIHRVDEINAYYLVDTALRGRVWQEQ